MAARGGYTKLFWTLAQTHDVVYDGQTKTLNAGTEIHLTITVDEFVCHGHFSTSPNPYDEASRVFSFPELYVVNYAKHTQSSGPRADTCTFYLRTPFKYAPPFLEADFGIGGVDTTTGVPNNPTTYGFYEQGVCSNLNASTMLFDKFNPTYIYNFKDGPGMAAGFGVLSIPLGGTNSGPWYFEGNQQDMHRWYPAA